MPRKRKSISEITITAHLDGRFAHSPEVSGFRYIFRTELAYGTFYIGKTIVGDSPPGEVVLIMKFKEDQGGSHGKEEEEQS